VPADFIQPKPPPLWLLVRVNALQSWRRFLSVRKQSWLLTGVIGLFVSGYLVVSFGLFLPRVEIHREIPGLGRGAHRTAALRAVCLFVRAVVV